MTALRKGSALYDEVFAGVTLLPFTAQGPDYTMLRNGFLDPANRTLFLDPKVMNAAQANDIRSGVQLAMQTLSVDNNSETVPNFPSALLPALRTVLASSDIDITLSGLGVDKAFSTVGKGNPIGTAGAVIGVGMAAVGVAVPLVGWIASAIIALASGIYTLVHAQQERLDRENAAHRARLYQSFPPLQIADSRGDGELIAKVLLPTLKETDWTRIYQPRFSSDDWVGIEREGGYAFAPGKRGANPDEFGGADAFEPSGGLGVIPGTDQVTAVVQVSLVHDPDAPGSDVWKSFLAGGADPRGIDANGVKGWTRVHDTGMYYPATGRLAASMWSLALAKGSLYKYRLDATKLHEEWRRWAEGGIRYIREVCYPWWPKVSDGNGIIKVGKSTNFEGFFGTGIFNSVGAWAGIVDKKKSTSQNPVYRVWDKPDGITGPELPLALNAYGMVGSPVSSTYSGGFLPILDPDLWPDDCMGNIYDRAINIAATLANLQALQRYELGHTLVAASCSVHDAAFVGDPKLADRLLSMRKILLESEDRMYIDMSDVPEDEPGLPGSGKTWRQQLIAAGVPLTPPKTRGALRMGPPGEKPPPPAPFVPGNPDPWKPQKPLRVGRPKRGRGGGGLGLVLGGTAALIFGGAMVYAARRRSATRSAR